MQSKNTLQTTAHKVANTSNQRIGVFEVTEMIFMENKIEDKSKTSPTIEMNFSSGETMP